MNLRFQTASKIPELTIVSSKSSIEFKPEEKFLDPMTFGYP